MALTLSQIFANINTRIRVKTLKNSITLDEISSSMEEIATLAESKANETHTHTASAITDFTSAVKGVPHTHTTSEIIDFNTAVKNLLLSYGLTFDTNNRLTILSSDGKINIDALPSGTQADADAIIALEKDALDARYELKSGVVHTATLTAITITGASTVNEGSNATYTVTGTYSDLTSAIVTTGVVWAVTGGYNIVNGVLTVANNSVNNDDVNATITATVGSLAATKVVAIKDTTPVVSDGSSHTYTPVTVFPFYSGNAVYNTNNVTVGTDGTSLVVSDQTIPFGQSGAVRARSIGGTLGLDNYPEYAASFNEMYYTIQRDVASGKVICHTSASVVPGGSYYSDNVATPADTTLVQLRVDGSTIYFEYSVDNGATWTVVKTETYTVALTIKLALYTGGGDTVNNIEQYGFN